MEDVNVASKSIGSSAVLGASSAVLPHTAGSDVLTVLTLMIAATAALVLLSTLVRAVVTRSISK